MKLSLLLLASLAAAAPVSSPISVSALHVKFDAPEGWKLNDSMAKDGWVSLYWLEAKDPVESSIDVFFYAKNSPLGSQEKYLAKLRADSRLKNLKTAPVKLKGGQAVEAVSDSEHTVGANSTKAKRTATRESHLILSRADGIVVLRLQASRALHQRQEGVLRGVAASVEPL